MAKKFIKRFMPDYETVRNHKALKIFGTLLHDPNLWHLNRRSASGAFAVGLFMAFMPVPFQMALAAAGAVVARVNLAISVALVWLTNPFTMPPVLYAEYKIGMWLMDLPPQDFEFTNEWILRMIEPLLIGTFVLAAISALLGWAVVRGLWRLHVVRHWQRKKYERARREVHHRVHEQAQEPNEHAGGEDLPERRRSVNE